MDTAGLHIWMEWTMGLPSKIYTECGYPFLYLCELVTARQNYEKDFSCWTSQEEKARMEIRQKRESYKIANNNIMGLSDMKGGMEDC